MSTFGTHLVTSPSQGTSKLTILSNNGNDDELQYSKSNQKMRTSHKSNRSHSRPADTHNLKWAKGMVQQEKK